MDVSFSIYLSPKTTHGCFFSIYLSLKTTNGCFSHLPNSELVLEVQILPVFHIFSDWILEIF